jgi:hypothetical protein
MDIRTARKSSGLSQTAAAELIYSTLRTWQDWEGGKANMHPGLWELFLHKSSTVQPSLVMPGQVAVLPPEGEGYWRGADATAASEVRVDEPATD